MEDTKLLESCPKCGEHITMMESVNSMTQEQWLVKRCLSCGNYPVTEVVRLDSYRKPSEDQAEIDRAITTMEILDITALDWAKRYRANPFEQDAADLMKRRSDDISLAITALRRMAGEGK